VQTDNKYDVAEKPNSLRTFLFRLRDMERTSWEGLHKKERFYKKKHSPCFFMQMGKTSYTGCCMCECFQLWFTYDSQSRV